MNKSDLKSGYLLELRDGSFHEVPEVELDRYRDGQRYKEVQNIDGELSEFPHYIDIGQYREDLTEARGSECIDIVAVYERKIPVTEGYKEIWRRCERKGVTFAAAAKALEDKKEFGCYWKDKGSNEDRFFRIRYSPLREILIYAERDQDGGGIYEQRSIPAHILNSDGWYTDEEHDQE